MAKPTILCVDDEIDNVEALERLFRKKFDVIKATSGQEALEILDQHRGPIAAILTDQRMPLMTGVEFLQQTLASHPETMRLLLTGYTDLESVISAVNQGQIFRYLTKPWDPVDLMNTMERAVERFELGQELQKKNAELAKAYEELKSLDSAKSNFMILVNHELKTPLTSVINFTSLLAESDLDEDQKLYVNRVSQSADRLKALIDDVLLVVKAEMGQLKTDVRQVELRGLLSEISPALAELARQKQQNIVEKAQPALVQADLVQIRQVLHRLIHNAVKFGKESSEILVESAVVGESLRLTVTNRGAPISEKTIDKIFRPFFIDEDIMHHSSGTGLGLTICQSLLQAQGSGLNIRNHDDGVSVSFTLPIVQKA